MQQNRPPPPLPPPPTTASAASSSQQQQQQQASSAYYGPSQFQQMWLSQFPKFHPTVSYQQMIQSSNSQFQQPPASSSECPLPPSQKDLDHVFDLIISVFDASTRESAFQQIAKAGDMFPDIIELLWDTPGVPAIMMGEIIRVAGHASGGPSATLTSSMANYACSLLNILQRSTNNPGTRKCLINSNVLSVIIPFIKSTSRLRSFEYLRITTLGVFGALVKTDDKDIFPYLISNDIIHACLKAMETAPEISKIVAAFVLQKVITDEQGLNYICQTYERFSQMAMILGRIVLQIGKEPEPRLLKHVIRCYLRLSENGRAGLALQSCLPESLKNNTFTEYLRDDPLTRRMLSQLLFNIEQGKQYAQVQQTTNQQGNSFQTATVAAVAAAVAMNGATTTNQAQQPVVADQYYINGGIGRMNR